MTTPVSESAVQRSVTIRRDLDTQVEARVGPRGCSAYVNKALETPTRLGLLEEIIAASVAEHGPVPAQVLNEIASGVRAGPSASGEVCNQTRGGK